MIVGAGVIGCYLGKKLGDQEIWDFRPRIMQKPCSGLLSRNVKTADIDINGLVKNEVKGAKFFSEKSSFTVESKTTQAYVLDRLALQKRLAQDAIDNGCKIIFNKKWIGEKDSYVLGADGAGSAVAKAMDIKGRKYQYAYQTYVTLKEKKDPDFVELHFGDFAPGFFGWYIPFDEKHGELAVASTNHNSREMFNRFKTRFKVKSIDKIMVHPIPIHNPKDPTVKGSMALVGDAAGQTKATTGGGIIFGAKCAEILADAVNKGDLRYYEKTWRKKYGNDLKLHLLISKLLHKNKKYDEILDYVSANNLDKIISAHGDMDHPKKMVSELAKKVISRPFMMAQGLKFLF